MVEVSYFDLSGYPRQGWCVCALIQHKNNIEHSVEPALPTSSLKLILFFLILSACSNVVVTYCCSIQGVPGGMCQTSGECSLGQTIPI